jgi:hypothetical protein
MAAFASSRLIKKTVLSPSEDELLSCGWGVDLILRIREWLTVMFLISVFVVCQLSLIITLELIIKLTVSEMSKLEKSANGLYDHSFSFDFRSRWFEEEPSTANQAYMRHDECGAEDLTKKYQSYI